MKTSFIYLIVMFLPFFTPFNTLAQIEFPNSAFEDDSTCDPEDCDETDMSCITGWWNFDSTSNVDTVAWIYYDDYFQCNFYDLELESCGGKRGIRISIGTGGGIFLPTTHNPFYHENNNTAYAIDFKINVFDVPGDRDVVVEAWVSADSTGTGGALVSTSDTIESDSQCHNVRLKILDASDVDSLTSYPFIIFKIRWSGHAPSQIVTAVMDEFSACTILKTEVSQFNCDQLCLEVTSPCDYECGEGCEIIVSWFDAKNDLIDTCMFTSLSDQICCITPPDTGLYKAFVDVYNDPDYIGIETEVHFQRCSMVIIDATTVWDATDIPEFTRFDEIIVESGDTLTIESDLTLEFCPQGRLVIEPDATVILNGTLTASCEDGWEGVEVQGNGATNQFHVLGVYPQGVIYCNEGSKIEYANTAVKLYGPGYEDAGGRIFAEGGSFINNRKGLDFAPFDNFFPLAGNQVPYASRIRNCVFDIDNEYVWPGLFTEHIRMYDVFGININGTSFGFHRTLVSPGSQISSGIGILAIDAGFNVGATAEDIENEPCLPPCIAINRSTFHGLGMGVVAGRIGTNRPFQVYNAQFSNCYTGIYNLMVSGSLMLFNDFEMGTVQEIPGDEDQIGISLLGQMAGLTLQLNNFKATEGNVDHTLGVVVEDIGEMDHFIRQNKFDTLTIGNEAFGVNGNFSAGLRTGLTYLCNKNNEGILNDFFVVDAALYDTNLICGIQGEFISGFYFAAGNIFSITGDPDDGDFGNYGLDAHYLHDTANIPIDFFGINLREMPENNCDTLFCLDPCVVDGNLNDVVSAYYLDLANLNEAMVEEDYDLANYYRMRLDSNFFHILRFLESDTSAYNVDTLRTWYSRAQNMVGKILSAGSYFGTGDFVEADSLLDLIPLSYALSSNQITEVSRVEEIYNILSSKSVFELSSADIDSLRLYSDETGISSAMARSALVFMDTVYFPRYYIPGEIDPRSKAVTTFNVDHELGIHIYPNPLSDVVRVFIPKMDCNFIQMDIFDLNGRVVTTWTLKEGLNSFSTYELNGFSEILFYRIKSQREIIDTGKLVKISRE